ELWESSPVFRDVLGEYAEVLDPLVGFSVVDVVRGQAEMPSTELAGGGVVDRVDAVQPVLFAVMVALARVWQSWGVQISGVVGHSQGEIAAAYVSGALSLEDAATVVALRSRALRALCGEGSMMSVSLPREDVEKLAQQWGGVGVAAVNGPATTVISGPVEGLQGVSHECERQGVQARWIPVDYASHSAHVERTETQLLTELAGIKPRSSEIPFYSTVAGERVDTAGLDAAYWYRNLRQTVLLSDTIEALAAAGHRAFVEVSAHPVLIPALHDILQDAVVVGSLRRGEGGLDRLVQSAAEAFIGGVDVDWTKVLPAGRVVPLPTYAFQRKRFWFTPEPPGADTVLYPWRYQVVWRSLPSARAGHVDGQWLVVVPAGVGRAAEIGQNVSRALADADGPAQVLELDAADPDRGGWAKTLDTFPGTTGIVSLLALAEGDETSTNAVTTVVLAQALLDTGLDARLWALTQGAVGTGVDDPVQDPVQAQIWGAGRVIGLEHPDRWGGLIDLPVEPTEVIKRQLAAVVSGSAGEDQVALRPGGVYGRRLVRARGSRAGEWRVSGTVVVTGGTGALGAHVARWLAGCGAEHLVLVSRRGLDAPGAVELWAELERLGPKVTIAACDITDRAALAALLEPLEDLDAVVHTAAVLDDGTIGTLTPDQMTHAARAKVQGAINLHELTEHRELSAFVLFSSYAALFGAPGLGNYAPGNAFLDGLAELRRARGLVATSVAWGTWAGDGMAMEAVRDRSRRHGLFELPPEAALSTLERVLLADVATAAIMDIRWDRFVAAYTLERPSRFVDEIPEVRALLAEAATGKAPIEPSGLREELAMMAPDEQENAVIDLLAGQVGEVLNLRNAGVDVHRSFKEMGFDSLTAVELRNRLNAITGLQQPVSTVFDYPDIESLTRHLLDELVVDPSVSVVDGFDRWESLLSDVELSDDVREDLVRRLRGVLVG
ncbi:MAG: type I polyketide synthase, partial [Pseudonocardiaceae bacterium]